MTDSSLQPLAWLFSIFGPLLLVASAWSYLWTRRWLPKATRHQAVVVDRGTGGEYSSTPPTVRWTDTAGMIQNRKLNLAGARRESWLARPESQFQLGQQLCIYDSPRHPTEAILDSTFGVWAGAILCLLLGSMLTVGGCFLFANG